MNKKSFFIFLIVAALFAAFTQSALADYTVQSVGSGGDISGYGPYQAGNGGEFTLIAGGGLDYVIKYYSTDASGFAQTSTTKTFQSFCLEELEYIYAGEIDKAVINDGAVLGGVNGKDPISIGTAWLYAQFASGTLAGYDYTINRKASATALQNTIWWLEGEAVDPTNSNIFRKAVVDEFGEADAIANNNGAYAVSVLNLTYNGKLRQDMLVATPIPPAIWLFGTGLIGLVGVRRRFTA